jgi:hypothetical protein
MMKQGDLTNQKPQNKWKYMDMYGILDIIGCYRGGSGKHIFRLLVWFAVSKGEGIRAPHAQA